MDFKSLIWIAVLMIPAVAIMLYPINVMIANRERERRREFIKELQRERMEMIRRLLDMRISGDDVGKLERLTGLFGKDKLAELLNQELDAAYADPFATEETAATPDKAKEGE